MNVRYGDDNDDDVRGRGINWQWTDDEMIGLMIFFYLLCFILAFNPDQ